MRHIISYRTNHNGGASLVDRAGRAVGTPAGFESLDAVLTSDAYARDLAAYITKMIDRHDSVFRGADGSDPDTIVSDALLLYMAHHKIDPIPYADVFQSPMSDAKKMLAVRFNLAADLVMRIPNECMYMLGRLDEKLARNIPWFFARHVRIVVDAYGGTYKVETKYILDEYLDIIMKADDKILRILSHMSDRTIVLLNSGYHVRAYMGVCKKEAGIRTEEEYGTLAKNLNSKTVNLLPKTDPRTKEVIGDVRGYFAPVEGKDRMPDDPERVTGAYDDQHVVEDMSSHPDLVGLTTSVPSIMRIVRSGSPDSAEVLVRFIRLHHPVYDRDMDEDTAYTRWRDMGISFQAAKPHLYRFQAMLGDMDYLTDHVPIKTFVNHTVYVSWNVSHREGTRMKEGWNSDMYPSITLADLIRSDRIIDTVLRLVDRGSVVCLQECDVIMYWLFKKRLETVGTVERILGENEAREKQNKKQMIVIPRGTRVASYNMPHDRCTACVINETLLLMNVHVPISVTDVTRVCSKGITDARFAEKIIIGDFNAVELPSYGPGDEDRYIRTQLITPPGFSVLPSVPLAIPISREKIDHVMYSCSHAPPHLTTGR